MHSVHSMVKYMHDNKNAFSLIKISRETRLENSVRSQVRKRSNLMIIKGSQGSPRLDLISSELWKNNGLAFLLFHIH